MSEFEREAHFARLRRFLDLVQPEILEASGLHLAGGSAIGLLLPKHRLSVDLDFMTSSDEGYRLLRNTVRDRIDPLLKVPLLHLRDVRTDQTKVWTTVEFEGAPLKIELVHEGRIPLSGTKALAELSVSVLDRTLLFAEKLLANADRGRDDSIRQRDLIDLAAMREAWGAVPREAWRLACQAYGVSVYEAFHDVVGRLLVEGRLQHRVRDLGMDPARSDDLALHLANESANALREDCVKMHLANQQCRLSAMAERDPLEDHGAFEAMIAASRSEPPDEGHPWLYLEQDALGKLARCRSVDAALKEIYVSSPGACDPMRHKQIAFIFERNELEDEVDHTLGPSV